MSDAPPSRPSGSGGSSESLPPRAPTDAPPPAIPGYRFLRRLGAGGMGAVWVVEQLSTHQQLALKLIHEPLVANAAFTQRFEREVTALRDIRHPNVVHVYDWNLPQAGGGTPYLVMELLRGEGLDELLRREPRLRPAAAVAVALQLLDAVAAAHRIGVLHRDLGPSNVFLVAQPEGGRQVKVLDFGLARPVGARDASDLTQPGTVMGKPGYIAPELLLEQPADERSDVFACGMVLYRMLAGRLPFHQRRAELLWAERFAERATAQEFPAPSSFVAELPAVLDAVVIRAIRRRPAERFQSVREMQNALLAAERGLEDEAPTSMAELPRPAADGDHRSSSAVSRSLSEFRHPTAARRRRSLVWTAAVAGAVLVGGALWWVYGRDGTHGRTGSSGIQVADVPPAAAPPSAASAPAAPPAPAPDAASPAVADAPPAVVPPVPPPAASPATVFVAFTGLPDDALLAVDGRPVDGRSLRLPQGTAPVPFEVSARGWETHRGTVVPDEDRMVTVELQRIAAGARPPRRDAGAARDAAGSLTGRQGTPFVTTYEE
jgi:serine/threonine-protein kinase